MAGAFRIEVQKAHRRHDLLFCLLVPLLVMLWIGGISAPSQDELENAYSALFYSIPVANVLILPIVMAVLASRLWKSKEAPGNFFILCRAVGVCSLEKLCLVLWKLCLLLFWKWAAHT